MKIFIGVEEHYQSDEHSNPIESTYTLLTSSLTRDGAIDKLLEIQRTILQNYIDAYSRGSGNEIMIADFQKKLESLNRENFSYGYFVCGYKVLEMDTDE
jgi:hypothetical protein